MKSKRISSLSLTITVLVSVLMTGVNSQSIEAVAATNQLIIGPIKSRF